MAKRNTQKQASRIKEAEKNLYSINRLAEHFGMDRGAVRRHLNEAKVRPIVNQVNKKLYRLEDAQTAVSKVAEIEKVRRKKLRAEAELAERELRQLKEEYLVKAEVEDLAQRLFNGLERRLVQQLPRKIGAQLFKSESASQLTIQLETSLKAIFNEFRNNPECFSGPTVS